MEIHEYDLFEALRNLESSDVQQEQITVKCDSCAAEFTFDPNVHADKCAFCGTNIVTQTGRHKQIKPRSLLPFHIDRRTAQERFRSWLKGLWLAPSKLKQYTRRDASLTGMYVPYWTFDSATSSAYQGLRGDAYQVPQRFTTMIDGRRVVRTRMVTKIRWTRVSGMVSRHFDDVLVLASRSLPKRMTDHLEPWDLEELVPYDEKYLSGFRSEVYQVELNEGFQHAKHIMGRLLRMDVARDIGGDRQRIEMIDTHHSNVRFKHVLLPIWLAAFRFRGKSYRFVVNARSGEVQGERPYSMWKIVLALIVGVIVLVTLFSLAEHAGIFQGQYTYQ